MTPSKLCFKSERIQELTDDSLKSISGLDLDSCLTHECLVERRSQKLLDARSSKVLRVWSYAGHCLGGKVRSNGIFKHYSRVPNRSLTKPMLNHPPENANLVQKAEFADPSSLICEFSILLFNVNAVP